MKETESIRHAISPRSDLHPADWCAEHVYLEGSEISQKFDPSQFRWWRKPMECMADYETRHMVCLLPPGFGKSAFFEAIACWIISEHPGPTLYLSQTDGTAEQWLETRAKKSFARCQPLESLWPINERNAFRKDAMIWPHMFMLAGGANVSNTQEVSIQYGLGDEAAWWKHGIVGLFLKRSHNRENRKFILASQAMHIASDDGIGRTSEIHLEHDKCRKWDFAWKCPGCGVVHPYKFEQLKWDTIKRGDQPDDQASADTVRRICPNAECAREFPDTPDVRRELYDSYQENDGFLMVSDTGLRGYEGFHVDYGANFRVPWAKDVMQKISADRQMALGDHTLIQEWFQQNRAVGYNADESAPKTVLSASGYTHGDYEEARKIDDEKARFMTIDAGGDHFWAGIRAWADGGSSKLLWCGYLATEREAEEKRILYGVDPGMTFLDVGFDQERMAGIITEFGWQGFKGDGNRKSGWGWEIKNGPRKGETEIRLYSKKWFAKARDGRRAQCWHLATEPLQYILQRLIDGDGADWKAHDDAPPTYAKHLNGERLVTAKDTRGHEIKKWTRFGPNHLRDMEVYQLACALMFRVFAPRKHEIPTETEE